MALFYPEPELPFTEHEEAFLCGLDGTRSILSATAGEDVLDFPPPSLVALATSLDARGWDCRAVGRHWVVVDDQMVNNDDFSNKQSSEEEEDENTTEDVPMLSPPARRPPPSQSQQQLARPRAIVRPEAVEWVRRARSAVCSFLLQRRRRNEIPDECDDGCDTAAEIGQQNYGTTATPLHGPWRGKELVRTVWPFSVSLDELKQEQEGEEGSATVVGCGDPIERGLLDNLAFVVVATKRETSSPPEEETSRSETTNQPTVCVFVTKDDLQLPPPKAKSPTPPPPVPSMVERKGRRVTAQLFPLDYKMLNAHDSEGAQKKGFERAVQKLNDEQEQQREEKTKQQEAPPTVNRDGNDAVDAPTSPSAGVVSAFMMTHTNDQVEEEETKKKKGSAPKKEKGKKAKAKKRPRDED